MISDDVFLVFCDHSDNFTYGHKELLGVFRTENDVKRFIKSINDGLTERNKPKITIDYEVWTNRDLTIMTDDQLKDDTDCLLDYLGR